MNHLLDMVIFQRIKYIIIFGVFFFDQKRLLSILIFLVLVQALCSVFPVPCFPISRSLVVVSTISPRKRISAAFCWIASTTICTWKGVAATLRLASSFPKLGWKWIPDVSRWVRYTTSCHTNTCQTKSCCRIQRTSPHPLNHCRCIWLWQWVESLIGESGVAVDRVSAQGGWVDKVFSFHQTRCSHSN